MEACPVLFLFTADRLELAVLSVLTGSSKLTPTELSARRLCSRVDMWRHHGGMSCACPGRLEVSRGIVEA